MTGILGTLSLDGASVDLGHAMTLDGKVWLTADARLDSRADLIRKLTPEQSPDDAELILHAYEKWGENCVYHLLGDFAFAIWDSRGRRFFCARDHFGVKPFFFASIANSFVFSNTLNALRLDPRVSSELNEVAVGDYLLFGLNQDLSTTIFRDIQRIPPAHSLTISGGSIKTARYWSAEPKQIRFRDRSSYVEAFADLLSSATEDRLPADNVTVSMSGGLDSTSLAAIARKKVGSLRACSVVYDRLIPDEERYYSTLAAEHLKIPIHHINADRYSLFDERVAGDLDQPEPFLLSPLAGQFNDLLRHCAVHGRVAITGYDGDAFLNEQPKSYFVSAAKKLQFADLVTGTGWYLWKQKQLPPIGLRTFLRKPFRKQRCDDLTPAWIDESFAKRIELAERLSQPAINPFSESIRPGARAALNSKVWAPLFEGYDPGATKLDLEVRHPFIDVRLVEFMLGIPAVPWCVNKHILRQAMRNQLPAAVLERQKTPLAGDPAIQLARHASVRWLDSFEVSPQLKSFVNLDLRRPLADEQTPDGLWASLRVFALNYWLANSQPIDRRASDKQVNTSARVSIA